MHGYFFLVVWRKFVQLLMESFLTPKILSTWVFNFRSIIYPSARFIDSRAEQQKDPKNFRYLFILSFRAIVIYVFLKPSRSSIRNLFVFDNKNFFFYILLGTHRERYNIAREIRTKKTRHCYKEGIPISIFREFLARTSAATSQMYISELWCNIDGLTKRLYIYICEKASKRGGTQLKYDYHVTYVVETVWCFATAKFIGRSVYFAKE